MNRSRTNIAAALAVVVAAATACSGAASDAELDVLLRRAAVAQEVVYTTTAGYTIDVAELDIEIPAGVRLEVARADDGQLCLEASAGRRVRHLDDRTGLGDGPCPGDRW